MWEYKASLEFLGYLGFLGKNPKMWMPLSFQVLPLNCYPLNDREDCFNVFHMATEIIELFEAECDNLMEWVNIEKSLQAVEDKDIHNLSNEEEGD